MSSEEQLNLNCPPDKIIPPFSNCFNVFSNEHGETIIIFSYKTENSNNAVAIQKIAISRQGLFLLSSLLSNVLRNSKGTGEGDIGKRF